MLGIAFFLLLFIASITTVFVMTNALMELQGTARITAEAETERTQERIEITSAYLKDNGPSRPLVLNVTNSGSVTAVLSRLIIINVTDNDHQVFSFNAIVNPGDSVTNTTQVSFPTGKEYEIRVVSERGNIASVNLVPAVRARVDLIAPGSALFKQNFTVVLLITNNDTSANSIFNLQPTLTPTSGLVQGYPVPASVSLLPAGSTAAFTYVYTAPSSTGTISFNASFVGAPQGNWVTATTTVIEAEAEFAEFAQFAFNALGLLAADIRPTIPNPMYKESNHPAFWGLTVTNSLNRSLTVYSVAMINPVRPLFDDMNEVFPQNGTWSHNIFATSSLILWSHPDGVAIPPKSAFNFTFLTWTGTDVVEDLIIFEAVTSEGKVTRQGAITSRSTDPTVNLFYTNDRSDPFKATGAPGAEQKTGKGGFIVLNLPEQTSKTYNLTIRNNSDNTLNSKVTVIVNVPDKWTSISASSQTNSTYWDPATITTNPDKSTSISVTSTVTSLAAGEVVFFEFSATSPSLTAKTLYVFKTAIFYPSFSEPIASASGDLVVSVLP